MSRQVQFCVTCCDTRVGQHVRVVGSAVNLGGWNPPASPALSTTAGDFPLWKADNMVALNENEVIEYKYVICDESGHAIRWEERPNRRLKFSDLVQQKLCPPPSTPCSIVEGFNRMDPADFKARFTNTGAERSAAQASTGARPSSQQFPEGEHPPGTEGDGVPSGNMFEKTMRERSSLSMSSSAEFDHLVRQRSSSISCFGEQGLDPNAAPEVTNADQEDVPGVTDDESSTIGGLFREESCSNLFGYDDGPQDGTDFNEFELKYAMLGQGPLGEGTFGLVWRCCPKTTPKCERAAKIVKKARLQPRDMRYLLGEDGEVHTHLKLKHPNIVELFEFFDESNRVTLVLEYCRGGDLFDAIVRESKRTRRGFPEPAAARATQHVLSALAYIHGHRVIHRDVKCENVLLASEDKPPEQNMFKLCDFGFSAIDKGDGFSDRLGSPDTVAPEVVAGKRYSFPADLWSAGTLVYMMLSATPPFWAPSDNEVLRKVRTGNYSLSGAPWDMISAPPKHMITSLMTVDDKLRPTATEALAKTWLEDLEPIPNTPLRS
eukprot:CAMPEP_0206526078 /NCGR_PEP_ID=MMETSP0325_2-20121206/488_1 /ASSEMBLY_ACC=CAM_ASM_000347 /TAXON_ID=2866 /ORGANISM="Crypthecodinium cohnii, Strain Seligo" /LENGTH=546 /DNA_ID=CAMNT_0054021127 /DNA_START=1 /DNA_END=1641 /DNA_ORIENTATION=+